MTGAVHWHCAITLACSAAQLRARVLLWGRRGGVGWGAVRSSTGCSPGWVRGQPGTAQGGGPQATLRPAGPTSVAAALQLGTQRNPGRWATWTGGQGRPVKCAAVGLAGVWCGGVECGQGDVWWAEVQCEGEG